MSKATQKTPLVLAVSTALTIGLSATSTVNAADNPFGLTDLSSGYMVVAEGKCGEGTCGGDKGKSTEGTCGGDKGKSTEGTSGGGDKDKSSEGKCGGKSHREAKCGSDHS